MSFVWYVYGGVMGIKDQNEIKEHMRCLVVVIARIAKS